MEALLGLHRPEDKVKQLERKVTQLVEESCFASDRGELQLVSMTDLLSAHTSEQQWCHAPCWWYDRWYDPPWYDRPWYDLRNENGEYFYWTLFMLIVVREINSEPQIRQFVSYHVSHEAKR